jgi:hypothetical protein
LKIRSGFMLREIAGSWVVVPLGQMVVEFNSLMTLNESGAMIWKKLETGAEMDELVDMILREYNVDENTARSDIQEIIDAMNEKGLLE